MRRRSGTTRARAADPQAGMALLWVVLLITLFAGLGGYMVRNSSVAEMAPLDSELATRAELLAESGYRLLAGEYLNAGADQDRNQILDELHGKTFALSASGQGRFSLSVWSYFYCLTADPAGGATVQAAFPGRAGTSVPSQGYLCLGADSAIRQYTAVSCDSASKVYTFLMALGDEAPSTPVWSTVRPAVQAVVGAMGEGGSLALGPGQGTIFPPKNGVFWIADQAYRYEYLSNDTLVNVTAPLGRTFTPIQAGTVFIVLNKFCIVRSAASLGTLAAAATTYQAPLDTSGDTATAGPETMIADMADLAPDANGLGAWEEVEVDGDEALKSTGERLIDSMNAEDVIQVLTDAAQTIRDASSGLARLVWGIVVNLLRLAADVLDALGILDNAITVPDELGRPKAFAYYDWWNAGFDMIGSWRSNGRTLSYDVQAKIAVVPDQDHYMAGLFLRSNNAVANGGNTLGVSIIRGDNAYTDLSGNGDGIPDALVPVNRTGTATPLIVIWAQKDQNSDGMITPGWYYQPLSGPCITLWPEEREWLAWAELPTTCCLLDPASDKYFADWITLMVRLDEKVLTAPSALFNVGERVNDITVHVSTPAACNGGGALAGPAQDYRLDNRRWGQSRHESGLSDIHWPVFDAGNLTADNDHFSLLGGGATQISWQGVRTSPSPTLGIKIERTGLAADKQYNAVIRIKAFTTAAYSDAGYPGQNHFPEEVGLHAFGNNQGVVYFDDFAIRFKGPDPSTGGGSGFFPPVIN